MIKPSPDNHPPAALTAVVVHWRNEDALARLLAAWPGDDPRFAIVVVDNSGSLGELPPFVHRVDPGHNLGFAGGVNRGVAVARTPWILVLNPDARPRAGALEALLVATETYPDAAGIVPGLEDTAGRSQCRWQLRPLPRPAALVLQTFRFTGVHGPRTEPVAGTPVAQPAAAALALRRDALHALGGFDTRYHPAWFEDVDLARRAHNAGLVLRFAPTARFVHEGGATVPVLGYGPFLWCYYRNLERYLRCHHGPIWSRVARITLIKGMLLRLALLPLRPPRQARGRSRAAHGLLAVCLGALSGWRWPRALHERTRPADPPPSPSPTAPSAP